MSKIIHTVAVFQMILMVRTMFFNVCPGRRISIGACLANLCPAESECINNYCCKLKTSTSPTDIQDIEENMEFPKCRDNKHAIGECISGNCPIGYECKEDLCCRTELRPIRITMIPVQNTTHSLWLTSTIFPSTSSLVIPEAEEDDNGKNNKIKRKEIDEEQKENNAVERETKSVKLTEIESIKNLFKKVKPKETTQIKMFPETTTVSEEYDIDYNGPGENVEVDDIAATTAGIATVTRIISRKRPSKKEGSSPIDEDNSEKATCPIGESIGECISNQCPEGHTCFNNECCIITPKINCTDELSGCLPHFCKRQGYHTFMTKNCAKTCALCHIIDFTGTEMENCRDRRSDCYEWSQEGFCESALYTTKQKLKFCGKSCNLC